VSSAERRGAARRDGQGIDADGLLRLAAAAASEVKPTSLIRLDLRGLCAFTDHFLIASAPSTRQVVAIAERIEERLRQERVRMRHREGDQASGWILLDYSDVIIHIFDDETRVYYDLEGLWADAPQEDLLGREARTPVR
jgi:ribosome-associated protein